MSDFRTTPPIVKPRKPYNERRTIIAVSRDLVLLESTGEVTTRAHLPHILAKTPGSIIVCENASALLMELDAFFCDFPGWSWRVTPVERKVYRQHKRSKPTKTIDAVVNYLGFRYDQESGRVKTHYHYPIDTLTFLSGSAFSAAGDSDQLRSLYDFGVDVRDFCRDNSLKISSTSGGLAAQLLRDPRFFPTPRRKVPKATNARARHHLPGNHYELFIPEDTTVRNALYLDMRSAHHYAASQLDFPHPDRMFGRGHFRNPPEDWRFTKTWARPGTPKFNRIIQTYGLFLLRIHVPTHLNRSRKLFPPPWLRKPGGIHLAWVYSNELSLIPRFGAIIEGIEAAWTAGHTDPGLNRYATWALTEAATMTPERKAWAKPTLLAAYGLLAARPRAREFGYREAKNGTAAVYPTYGGPLAVQALRTSKEIEAPIVNVILRGMIEAQVRLEVITLAGTLHDAGVRILALYADSVIIEPTAALPLLPEPWTVKTELTRLTFFNPVSFVSDQMERLPGISREGHDRLTLRSVWRAHLGAQRQRRKTVRDGWAWSGGVPWSARGLDLYERVDGRWKKR